MGAESQRVSPHVKARNVLKLAIPASLAALLQHAFRPIDQYYVGWLGREEQGALGATTFVIIVAYGGYLLMSAGVGPLVARHTGRGDEEARAATLGAGLLGGACIYAMLMVIGVLGSDTIVGLLGLQDEAAAHASLYLRVLFLTGCSMAFGPIIDASFAAMGNTVLPLIIQAGVLALNAVFTPVLMFGLGMGVEGAALGSTMAQTVGVIVGLTLLWRRVGLQWRHLSFSPLIGRVARIGAPIATATAMYALVYWALLGTSISRLGSEVNAALGIGFSGLEALSWPMYLGTAVAVSSIVGRKLGEGRVDDAWASIRMVIWPQIAFGTFIGFVFFFVGPYIVQPFAADAMVYKEAVCYAMVLAWSQPFVATETLFEGVLSGAGDTRRVFWGTVPFNLLRIPMAWWMAFPLGMGAAGVWWAINITTIMKAGLKGWMVYRGGWSRLEL